VTGYAALLGRTRDSLRAIGLSAWYLQVSAGSTKISGLQQRTVDHLDTVRITAKSLLHLQC
jgi:hypothetical protein